MVVSDQNQSLAVGEALAQQYGLCGVPVGFNQSEARAGAKAAGDADERMVVHSRH